MDRNPKEVYRTIFEIQKDFDLIAVKSVKE